MESIALTLYIALTAVTVLFQLALVAGAPWGRLTQGGSHPGMLPVPGRLVALLSAVLLVWFAWGMVEQNWVGWFATGYLVLGLVMNSLSKSKVERMLWVPVIAVLLVSAWIRMG